ncbi:saccharopine dehydrogenase [Octadecabacter sp. R77987]|uniref:saccharopine dehydrogenase n=1 Tax=Octadecabacter sp. R77987 TaxID=3093874 RepID=UPI00366F90CA
MHLWVRAEQRDNEQRVGVVPDGAADLIAAGFTVTVEDSATRIIPTDAYRAAGCTIAPEGSWPGAPADAVIFGLKELPDDGTPLTHRHIMFGHAFKGQPSGRVLLDRFNAGGGTLYDLEYLTDADGRRVAAFGYWAGYAGAAVSLLCLAAQRQGKHKGPVSAYPTAQAMREDLRAQLDDTPTSALIIGALGRVGTGAADLCREMNVDVTLWDMAETASGGPFPEVLQHDLFFNCILARPGTPVFVPLDTGSQPRTLRVIGDIACDPDSDFSPIKVYSHATTWAAPALRVHDTPPLDVMAIDNLPSLLPLESAQDFSQQVLPHLMVLQDIDNGVWGRARAIFADHA